MATRGRKPKPDAVKRANGSYVKNPGRRNNAQPKPKQVKPKMPSYFRGNKGLRNAWNDICKTLDDMNVLTVADARIIELAAVAYNDMLEARVDMLKIGRTVKGRQSTIIKNPINCEYHKAADRYFKLLVELGLSPSARTRLSVTPADTEEDIIGDLMRELGHSVN